MLQQSSYTSETHKIQVFLQVTAICHKQSDTSTLLPAPGHESVTTWRCPWGSPGAQEPGSQTGCNRDGIAGWQNATHEVMGKHSEQLSCHAQHQHCGAPLLQKGFPAKAQNISDTRGVQGTAMGITARAALLCSDPSQLNKWCIFPGLISTRSHLTAATSQIAL